MRQYLSYLQNGVGGVGLLLLLLGCLAPQQARASHALGADMSYINVGPGLYFVQYRFYRDCSGISAPANFSLDYSATGCGPNNVVNAGGSRLLLPRLAQAGNPYCTSRNNQLSCDSMTAGPSNGYPNYSIYTYAAIVNLNAPNRPSDCTEWVLSTEVNARPNTRNLGFGTDLYTEVRFNNKLVPDDHSPAFSTLAGLQPLAIMYEHTLVRYNASVVDPDGDSLVYSMQRPLSGPNSPIAYVNGHSLQAPVRLLAGSAPLHLDAHGTLVFTPGDAIANTQDDQDNKFAVVLQVEAWRRINGVPQRLSTVRREIAAVIVRATTVNEAPFIATPDSVISVIYPNSAQLLPYGDTIYSYVGEALEVSIPILDTNGDSIFVEMPPALSPLGSVLSGPVYEVQTPVQTRARVRILWTPTAADLRPQAHSFYLLVRDNGCPNKSIAFYPLSVMVAAQRPLGVAAGTTPRQPLLAAPNPFSTSTRLTVAAPAPGTPAHVRIYDLTGRLIDQLTVSSTGAVDWHAPATLPAGAYVARYTSARGPQTVRLLKQ